MHSELPVCQHCFTANIAMRTFFWAGEEGVGVLNAPRSKLILDGPKCILMSELSVDGVKFVSLPILQWKQCFQ